MKSFDLSEKYGAPAARPTGLLTLTLVCLVLGSRSQALELDAFNPGVNGGVSALAMQPDGRILVGGTFTTLAGGTLSFMGRLQTDGALDSGFNPRPNGAVNCLAVQRDGQIVIGGAFTSLAGQPRGGLGRLHSDGTIDTNFNTNMTGSSSSYFVSCLAIQPDDKILVGGYFTVLGAAGRSHLGRLNADGTLDATFHPILTSTTGPSWVTALELQPDGKILIAGSFMAVSGVSRINFARLNADGSLDESFDPGAASGVNNITVQPDGKILVGGSSLKLAGQWRNSNLARLNSDGSVDAGFNPTVSGYVNSLALQTDGSVLVSSAFTSCDTWCFCDGEAGGASYCDCEDFCFTSTQIDRYSADGIRDSTFATNSAAFGPVNVLLVQPDGKILAGGTFSALVGKPRANLGRFANSIATQNLLTDGTKVTWLRGGTSPEVGRVAFDVSTNGTDWISIGQGSRVSGGWEVNAATNFSGTDRIRARGFIGGDGSSWIVESLLGPPVLTQQPASRTNDFGTIATFHVFTPNVPSLNLQWLKNGAALTDGGNVSGANTTTLSLSNVIGADAGDYSVVLSNSFGSVTSAVATLTVNDPIITTQPINQFVNRGESVRLGVDAIGSGPLNYQWRKDGEPLSGATAASLTITNVQGADAGRYDVVVSNSFGTLTSAVAQVSVNLAMTDTFRAGGGGAYTYLNGWVNAMAVQPDGKILVGGVFNSIDAEEHHNIGRLNSDGTVDASFTADVYRTGYNGVHCLGLQADGRILVGGQFSALDGLACTNLGRLLPDGSPDPTFSVSVGNGEMYSSAYVAGIVTQPDEKILVAGFFPTLCGKPRQSLGRLNPDGTLDASFNVGIRYASDLGWVDSVAVQPDGKILVAGSFTTLGGVVRSNLARLNADGTVDASFDPRADGTVFAVTVQPDGKILAGGRFNQIAGQTRPSLARLNSDGSLDVGFTTTANGYVLSLALQADGKIIVGGSFSQLGGLDRTAIGRLNSDGSVDADFFPNPTRMYFGSQVTCVAVQADGRILVGGGFESIAGQSRPNLARLENTAPVIDDLSYDGATIAWRRGGSSPEISRASFDASTNGAEWFHLGDGVRVSDGWQLSGLSAPANAYVRARGRVAAGWRNGSEYFVETFIGPLLLVQQPISRTNNAGTTATFAVRVHGTAPIHFQWRINGIALADDARISGAHSATLTLNDVLGGDSGNYSVVISNVFGSVTSDDAALTVVDPVIIVQPVSQQIDKGTDATLNVTAIGTTLTYQWRKDGTPLAGATGPALFLQNAAASDGGAYDVLVRSSFGSVTSAVAMLTVNVAITDAFDPNPSLGQEDSWSLPIITAFAVQPDGKVVVGGWFNGMGDVPCNSLARVNADGTVDTNFTVTIAGTSWDALPPVNCVAVQPDGKILVGGNFLSINGESVVNLGRLNVDGSVDRSFSNALFSDDAEYNSDKAHSLAVQPDGKILVSGLSWNSFARLNTDGSLDTTFNLDPRAHGAMFALQSDGKILLAGSFNTDDDRLYSGVARLNSDGTLDPSFPNVPVEGWLNSLTVQADGKILLGGRITLAVDLPYTMVIRLNADGSPDTTFASESVGYWGWYNIATSLAVQADGQIIVGGSSTYLSSGEFANPVRRLHPDGSVDQSFAPHIVGAGDSEVNALAIQSDGNILVGGMFYAVNDQSRQSLARLSNSLPAVNELDFDGATVTWRRGGSAPEVSRASFEFSADGVNWTNAGAGTWVDGGWQLATVDVPVAARLRARGFVSGGQYNGSCWIVESPIHVFTTSEAVTRLIADASARAPRPEPLAATLNASLASIERGNLNAAINQLQAFQNQVHAQIASTDSALAEYLIRSAQAIIDALNGDQQHGGRRRGQITALRRENNGHARIKFIAEPGRNHLVEASSDLRTWEVMGVGVEGLSGAFEFEDADAPNHEVRFYRIETQ